MIKDQSVQNEILDSLAEGVLTVDKSFKINYFNKAAEKITGFNKEEVLGQFCKYILRSERCEDCPISQVLRTGKKLFDYKYQMKNKEGQFIQSKLNVAVLYNDCEEPTGGVVTFRDLTEIEKFKESLDSERLFHGIVGRSSQMLEIFELVRELANTDAPVFIHGESGTGKEMIANAIQETSSRKDRPFIKINCSVFPHHLLASELFGHVKGAFTDAIKDRTGRFEAADGGTIFLDEVAEMPLQMQLQLLRVIQEGTFERVGESSTRKVDVKIITATNIDIEQALEEGKFRQDLYYRLNVIPIEIPPLRERPDDILPLAYHFLKELSFHYKKEISDFDEQTIDILLNYDWPGNVRELKNVIEYAFVRTFKKELINSSKLPPNIRKTVVANKKSVIPHKLPPEENEEKKLIEILERHKWNKSKAAKELGIGRTTLWRKLKKLGLDSF